jgi:hypothetical protein
MSKDIESRIREVDERLHIQHRDDFRLIVTFVPAGSFQVNKRKMKIVHMNSAGDRCAERWL